MRGSIWPNFARRLPGKIWPNRAAHFSSRMRNERGRFGQILPGGCPAKFGQIEPRLLEAGNHLIVIAYDEQPDLAKFCPQTAREKLAKSSR